MVRDPGVFHATPDPASGDSRMTENAQRQLTITLLEGDWSVILTGLYELPMKFAGPVAARLQTQLADAQKPPAESTGPHLVTGSED
jgi:hypothetical protein